MRMQAKEQPRSYPPSEILNETSKCNGQVKMAHLVLYLTSSFADGAEGYATSHGLHCIANTLFATIEILQLRSHERIQILVD